MARASGELSTVTNAVRLLDQFNADERVLGTTELAKRLQLPKSTTHRLIGTLATHGLLDRQVDGRYRLGLRLFELASLVLLGIDVRAVALPHLQLLSREAGETVHLAVREGLETVYIEKIEADRLMRMYSRIGRRAPMHCTGVGKAILAFEPEAVVSAVVAAGLARYTAHTIIDEERLRAELDLIRTNGYAWDREEIEEGLRCVAVPILDHLGCVVAGLSIAGPSQRMTLRKLQGLTPRLLAAGEAISRSLGFGGWAVLPKSPRPAGVAPPAALSAWTGAAPSVPRPAPTPLPGPSSSAPRSPRRHSR